MLRFKVYDCDGPAQQWALEGAYLFGPDDIAAPGRIEFKKGEIRCHPTRTKATGLALQYDAGRAGRLILQTCLLPESDRPYVLSHELARHRIKTFLVKSEEWQMFELSLEHPAVLQWEQARQHFTRGLNEHDPVKMDEFGRESLEHAIEATERLAMAHAEILLHRRYGAKPASSNTLGLRISPRVLPERHAELLNRDFDLLYIPLVWRDIEPRQGEFDWEPLDKWMSWAQNNKKLVVAGPMLDFSRRSIPDWMTVSKHDYDATRNEAYDYIERLVNRYSGWVSIWSIAAGLNTNSHFEFTEAQMLDLTRMANLMIRQNRRGRTMLEIVEPFGEHVGESRGSIPPLAYISRINEEGIRVDCYGVQVPFGEGAGALRTRDLMALSDLLDRYFLLELPVLITRAGVPSEQSAAGDEGYWHLPWNEEVQQSWIGRAFGLSMSKPHVQSFFWAELIDGLPADIQHAGLLRDNGETKPVYKRLTDMRRRLRKAIGPLRLQPKEVSSSS